jgi:hypothetical protein
VNGVTVFDDWASYINSQIASAEQWASANPITAGFIVVVVSGVLIMAASKAADVVLGH